MQVQPQINEPPSLKQRTRFSSQALQQQSLLQKCHSSSLPTSPNNQKIYFSPESKKTVAPDLNGDNNNKLSSSRQKDKKVHNMLFTIEQNFYFRKNPNIISPRPPKYRSPTQRLISSQQIQGSQCSRQREKRVAFTESLINQYNPRTRKENFSSKPIIRNINNSNFDNMSNSSKSISVQNSLVSQLRPSYKREKPRADSNRQRYSQIMSHFQSSKQSKNQRFVQKTLSNLRTQGNQIQRYTDNIFPPVPASLFLNPLRHHSISIQISWRRISQFFADAKLVLLGENTSETVVFIDSSRSYASDFLAIAFNAVKHSRCILERIFQDQNYNQHGLYFTKIFQQNNWKSIIIDDFIPIRRKLVEGNLLSRPAFIQVKYLNDKILQIWPFLLQKAFSNYYSAYEMMRYGNTIDLINQIMGLVPFEFKIKKKVQKQFNNLKNRLADQDSFAIGQSIATTKMYIIRIKRTQCNYTMVYSSSPDFIQQELDQALFQQFKKIYFYSPRTYNTLSTAIIGKYGPSNKTQEKRSQYSLRKLIIYQNSQCLIALQQKQGRFFCKSSNKYAYMWIRTMLVQRQFNGYQWIQGNYTNSKSTVLSASLSPGQYYLIIMPEWRQNQNYQLSLLVWGNHFITIQRQKGGSTDEMVEHACMDLAQRKGKINQLAPTLCSYNYICPRTGLIIQNINNEKLKQEVSVHRKIAGIPCNVELLPVNKQFWEAKANFKEEIDISIPKLSSYTIVLRMRGGMDRKLIKMFSSQKDK